MKKKYDLAENSYKKVLELSPKKQAIYFELAGIYLNKGDKAKALEVAKKAYDLAPEFEQARLVYATTAIYASKDNLVKDLLTPVYGSIFVADNRIVSAYIKTKQFNKVIKIWKLQIEKDPNNPQFHLSLGSSYLSLGKRAEAISEIKKAMELNPAIEKQAEYYINEIKAGRNP